jgi:hypothetical protein
MAVTRNASLASFNSASAFSARLRQPSMVSGVFTVGLLSSFGSALVAPRLTAQLAAGLHVPQPKVRQRFPRPARHATHLNSAAITLPDALAGCHNKPIHGPHVL